MRRLRGLAGLFLVGYGLLVVFEIIAHEAFVAGLASVGLGLLFLYPFNRSTNAPPDQATKPALERSQAAFPVRRGHASLIAGLGAVLTASLILYNLLIGSSLGTPEWGLLLYGLGLIIAASFLDSPRHGKRVSTLVGWSFPLVLAPLALFAFNGLISGPSASRAGSAASPVIHYALTLPTAWTLEMLGTASHVEGNNIILSTQGDTFALGVGLVCAGIYPAIMFLGILGMHAWQERLPRARFASYLLFGLGGLYVANLTRLMILVKVGETWDGAMLQQVHAHLGWIFFVGFMVLFWGLVLRRLEPGHDEA